MRIRLGKLELRIFWHRRPQLLRRVALPKAQPPINYDPDSIWQDYFALPKNKEKNR